jgi:hypothetical protein
MEKIGLFFSMALTLMVLSYILGDNPLFRVAEHIFVGVSIAYGILVAWHLVLVPTFFAGGFSNDMAAKIPPAVLCFLLIFKIQPRQSEVTASLGSIGLAFLVGVGAALAIGGALFGTLLPQVTATASIDLSPAAAAYADAPGGNFFFDNDFLSNIVVLIGTVGTLFYFTFTYRPKGFMGGFREGFVNFWAGMGRWVILITMGALFSNTVSARIALLLSRVVFLVEGVQRLISGS